MKKNLKITISIFIFCFILILIFVMSNKSKNFDNMIYNFIISFRSPFLDNYFKFITRFGNTNTITIILLLFILLFRDKKSFLLTISTTSCVIVNSLVKQLIRRKRPNILRLIKQGGYSFPSGHAMISICLYGYLLYLVNKNIKNKIVRLLSNIFLIILIFSLGISRIYVGVHFATDVIAGYLLGLVILLVVINYPNKSKELRYVKNNSN